MGWATYLGMLLRLFGLSAKNQGLGHLSANRLDLQYVIGTQIFVHRTLFPSLPAQASRPHCSSLTKTSLTADISTIVEQQRSRTYGISKTDCSVKTHWQADRCKALHPTHAQATTISTVDVVLRRPWSARKDEVGQSFSRCTVMATPRATSRKIHA
ncbi:hypothetical protein E1B28_007871 [Marasmius oreades]|uniref:Secreted protein n=1 Tax=Marasmius oreades TaxID=181124 RepID=A0A9P7S373_9AGAR|nr:uncharacterized protein E1B28_007871 [Marasmius oreades]KAG7094267.1 hypothetical protein E1B28_007871 [Marasmius oreades]